MAKRRSRPTRSANAITRLGRWRSRFLAALAETANVSAAVDAAGVSRVTVYRLRDTDKAFSAAWKDALEQGADAIELEALRRAKDGVDEPVIYQGKLCGMWVDKNGDRVPADGDGNPIGKRAEGAKWIPLTVKRYSDGLLMFLMRAARPNKFRERHHITHEDAPGIRTPEEGASAAAQLLDGMRKRMGIVEGQEA